ncbi:recombinase family protein [Pseudonocardia alni]|uniref:recombinase family protein n=1 Tax=Pseudonocardia alni TaxID=33907 RepID=UPI00371D752E
MSTRTVVYVRVSQDRDGRSTSVGQQEAECRRYAESRGLEVTQVLVDNDISAYTGKRRPSYERLLEVLAAGEADAVLVWSQDRLTRRPMELERYIDVCEPRSIPTYSVTGGELDLTTSVGRMQARIAGAVNRNEVDQLRQRVSRGLKGRAEQGLPVGGRRPFGFLDDRITHHPVEAAAVREASEAFVRGDSLHAIARRWREAGLTTTAGGEFTGQKVGRILQRHRNVARREYQGRVIGKAAWEPLVDYRTWVQVQEVLSDPSRRTNPGNQVSHLGSFIYRCGVCGAPMRSGRGGGADGRWVRPPGYKCSAVDRVGKHPVIPAAPADLFVVDFMLRGLHEQGAIPFPDDTAAEAVGTLEARVAELEEKRTAWTRRALAGLISDTDLDEALTQIQSEIEQLNEEVAAPPASSSDMADLASQRLAWDELSIDRQRAILRDYADVEILPATSTRQPVYYEVERDGETVLRSDRIRVKLRLDLE